MTMPHLMNCDHNEFDEFFSGAACGFVICLLFSTVIWGWVLAKSFQTMDKYRNIQEQAIQREYATWGQSVDGDRVFMWKDQK